MSERGPADGFDLILVGSGCVALACALSSVILNPTLKCLILEKCPSIEETRGETSFFSGCLHSDDPHRKWILQRSVQHFQSWFDVHKEDIGFRRTGGLFPIFDASQKTLLERSLDPRDRTNALAPASNDTTTPFYSLLEAPAPLIPLLGDMPTGVLGAYLFPNDCVLSAPRFRDALFKQAVRAGVTFCFSKEVVQLSVEVGSGLAKVSGVRTRDGSTWGARAIVLAAGASNAALIASLPEPFSFLPPAATLTSSWNETGWLEFVQGPSPPPPSPSIPMQPQPSPPPSPYFLGAAGGENRQRPFSFFRSVGNLGRAPQQHQPVTVCTPGVTVPQHLPIPHEGMPVILDTQNMGSRGDHPSAAVDGESASGGTPEIHDNQMDVEESPRSRPAASSPIAEAARLFPTLTPELNRITLHPEQGTAYHTTPDGCPLLGWLHGEGSAPLHGLFLLAGYQGQGLLVSPALGELAGRMIAAAALSPVEEALAEAFNPNRVIRKRVTQENMIAVVR
ncbi:hypothetical protein PAPYR_9379 [Paratrimastix pyriformis]|uniref:FAD dependent oxidoreductase domain-containing protein n=1 Tax=Paratrimastix pyriformis TaxID=342808 RepID=A0ABQ8U8J7_9EUKA|nr:hypothetical protein PAPYR_9379 [Paratrimastix pyriformis]